MPFQNSECFLRVSLCRYGVSLFSLVMLSVAIDFSYAECRLVPLSFVILSVAMVCRY
jgi:hypothetical protein